tara:strand:+ start:2479 stop:3366 length:888 start_codon:yes stop_codon:yes gene_type:complete
MRDLIQEAISSSKKVSKDHLIEKIIPVGGGCIHKAWCVYFQNGKKVFAKSNHINNINMFEFERECLIALKKFANESYLYIPQPLDLISYKNTSIFCLEWIDLTQSQQNILGQGLALLHKSSTEENNTNFGWERKGFIGSNSQKRGWDSDWGEFFVNYRLRPQLVKAAKWGVLIEDYDDILKYLSLYLNDHNPKVSLVHGDLWSGNCGGTKNGLGSLYDPASYWADSEVDISMTQLFGNFDEEFYKGYEKILPIKKSSKDRTEIYNLYHLLNHANMFGGSYKVSSLKVLKDLRSRL